MAVANPAFSDETVVVDYSPNDYARKVVVCVDQSEVSAKALKWAVDHVLRPDDLVILLRKLNHLVRILTQSKSDCHQPYLLDQEALGLKDDAARILKDRIEQFPPTFNKIKAISMLDASVGFRLYTKISEIQPAFVVCGTRGEGPLSKALHGSVSDYLMHTCSSAWLPAGKRPEQLHPINLNDDKLINFRTPNPMAAKYDFDGN
ncbi:hypothetical protein HDU84_001946 [Entophlyctis sp. JEL0112]|nr:hypothetical protein HDU84_001946 [Entophlyctis sp. JEL0112]